MFCKNCGQQMSDDAKFCPACGDRVAEKAVSKPAERRKKGKKALCALLIVLAALLLIGGALWLYTTRQVAEIPDPADFFGLHAQETTSGRAISWMFMSDEDPLAAFEAYVDYIEQNVDGLRVERADWSDGGVMCDFIYDGFWPGNPPQFRVLYKGYVNYSDEVGYTYLINFYSDKNFGFADCEPFSGNQTGNETADSNAADAPSVQQSEQPDEPATVGSLALPDIDAFLGYAPPTMDEPADAGGWNKYYELSIDEGWQAGTEYVQLLLNDPRYQFKLVDSFNNTTAWLYSEYYFFEYIGEEKITPVQDVYYLGGCGYQDFTTDLYIRLERNGKYGKSTISIYYSNDLVMGDYGDRSSLVPSGADGSSGGDFSPDDPYIPDFAKEPCLTCNGDGDCTRCNGYGTIKRYNGNGEYIDSSCPDCNGSGNCRTCGGSGTRE